MKPDPETEWFKTGSINLLSGYSLILMAFNQYQRDVFSRF